MNNISLFFLSTSLFFLFLGFWGTIETRIIEKKEGEREYIKTIERAPCGNLPVFTEACSLLCFLFFVLFIITLIIPF